jgi:hypothetical protein
MRSSLLLVDVALSLLVFAAAPFSAQARDAMPNADEAMKQAPGILKEVLARTRDDKHLAATAKPPAAVEEYKKDNEAGFCLRYETADSWPDLPSKPKGQAPGNGSVQVKIVRGRRRPTSIPPSSRRKGVTMRFRSMARRRRMCRSRFGR